MSNISVTKEGACVATPQKLSIPVTKHDLLWAMIYANKIHQNFKSPYDLKKYVDMQNCRMKFIFDCSGVDLTVNDCVYKLEKTYKGTIAFDIGMIIACLVCKSCLNLKHLYHLKSMKYSTNSGCNVDFISQNATGYYAVESKGTLGKVWYGEKDALNQLAKVGSINGKSPIKYATLTRCTPKKHCVECRLIDPENENLENLKINEEFWDYQKNLLELFEKEFKDNNLCFRYVEAEGAFWGVSNPNFGNSEERMLDNIALNNKRYKVKVFEDGTIIGLKDDA